MGKSFLRFELSATFGVISSPGSSIALIGDNSIACPTNDDITIWNTRKNTKVRDKRKKKKR